MFFENKITVVLVLFNVLQIATGENPNFRVLAPEFVCPNDEDALIETPDNTLITVQTDVIDLQLSWTVRWVHLETPSQRFTLLLWRSVRSLEAKLNAPQPEPLVYVIDNSELLRGVEYIFNVTARDPDSENEITKSFSIDNIKGDPKLMIEGRSDKFSVLLIGSETVYSDMEYVVEAEVTTCSPTQDYYFVWTVHSASAGPFKVSATSGSRLEIPSRSLRAGAAYHVTCIVNRNNHQFITQTGLPFQVLYRKLEVSLNLDVLVVTRNKEFTVEAVIASHDYSGKSFKIEWFCHIGGKTCHNFKSSDSDILTFKNGLPNIGQYRIAVSVNIGEQQKTSSATIHIVQHSLPVIQISPLPRILLENSTVILAANASNVAPSCTLTWYFANEESLASLNFTDQCEDCQHGEALSDSLTVFSLEENFLNELTDFTNETEWRQVTAEMKAQTGRARFVAQCGCSLTFSCETQGTAYGDVNFKVNGSPKAGDMKVLPETGTAMETIFRVSTTAAADIDKPIRYTFYCNIGANDLLILGSNLEYLAVETFLPYTGVSGTVVWVEVCDSLGACSLSDVTTVQVSAGSARTVQHLVDTIQGHVGRCEMMVFRRLVKSTVTTYKNANQDEALSEFSKALLETLQTTRDLCIKNRQDYFELIDWLIQAGVDLTSLLE